MPLPVQRIRELIASEDYDEVRRIVSAEWGLTVGMDWIPLQVLDSGEMHLLFNRKLGVRDSFKCWLINGRLFEFQHVEDARRSNALIVAQ